MRLTLAGVIAIVVFATIGQLSHRGGVSPGGYAADVLPLAVAWIALALWTKRFVPTWLGGVTLGVAARMAILGHYRGKELAFWLVSVVFIGLVAIGAIVAMRWAVEDSAAQ